MNSYFSSVKIKNTTPIIIVFILLLSAFMIDLSREQTSTLVSVVPSDQTVGQADELLPTSPFTINITVESVVDLYAWQVVVYYNSTILREENITLPLGHIFDGKQFFELGPFIESDSKGNYTIFGATLSALESTFSGSGILCQINFTGQARGTSSVNLDITTDPPPPPATIGYYTYLLDSNFNEIPISTVNGQVTVVGLEKLKVPSAISINVSPTSVTVGSNVTISGEINVTRSNVEVTIYHKVAESATWYELGTNRTGTNGQYTYAWDTSDVKANIYELKAKWLGDAIFDGAESNPVTVTVNKMASTISLNASPKNVIVGSIVTINGDITPKRGSVGVIIFYRPVGGTWTNLPVALVITSVDGVYSYSWTTTKVGSFELKSRWDGDDYTLSAESDVITTEVTGGPPEAPADIMTYLPYVIAAIVIIAAIGIYFTKIKKR